MNDTGYFLFSLDTELGTGYFDKDEKRYQKTFSMDGKRERESINRILELVEKYQIKATWAVVGHLFFEQCENCEVCPILSWKDKYWTFDMVYQSNHPLWYGADVIDKILQCNVQQEIGFHGYTHEIFDEKIMTEKEARIEIYEWLKVAKRRNIRPTSIVFPRDKDGYHSLFADKGFLCFRSEPLESIWIRNKYFGKYLKTIDYLLNCSRIFVYKPEYNLTGGLVDLPASQHLFNFNRKLELWLDKINLPHWRNRRILDGIKRVAKEKKVIHLWAHPWEFRTEKDFEKLEKIFAQVAQYQHTGEIISLGMSEFALFLSQNHNSLLNNE